MKFKFISEEIYNILFCLYITVQKSYEYAAALLIPLAAICFV